MMSGRHLTIREGTAIIYSDRFLPSNIFWHAASVNACLFFFYHLEIDHVILMIERNFMKPNTLKEIIFYIAQPFLALSERPVIRHYGDPVYLEPFQHACDHAIILSEQQVSDLKAELILICLPEQRVPDFSEILRHGAGCIYLDTDLPNDNDILRILRQAEPNLPDSLLAVPAIQTPFRCRRSYCFWKNFNASAWLSIYREFE